MRLDTMYNQINEPAVTESEPAEVSELVEWFSVSGDMDDFIYYGEDRACSER